MSTQTQLASLRGALEAARLREEKHKAEMERYSKELEALRWENMNSRRGEAEVGTWFYFIFLERLLVIYWPFNSNSELLAAITRSSGLEFVFNNDI